MNVLGRIFVKSRKDSRKDGVFFVRFRRTYFLNKLNGVVTSSCINLKTGLMKLYITNKEGNVVSGYEKKYITEIR